MDAGTPASVRLSRLARPGRLITLFVLILLALIVDAMLRDRGDFDYRLMRRVGDLSFPGDRSVLTFVSDLTGQPWAVLGWAAFLTGALVLRRWLVAVMLFVFPLAGGVNLVLRQFVERPRPNPGILDPTRDPAEVARILAQNDFASFPSGHVVGAVLLYGFAFALAAAIPRRAIRWPLQAACLAIILTAGIARVWIGSHWVGDVLAGYALGGAFLVATVALYRAMAPTTSRIPLVRAAPVPHDDTLPHAHALTSTILFRDGRVYKIYNPGFVPRMAYWLSFQAPFAYAHSRRALEAAVLRRNLAGLLTEYWYGTNRVSLALGVELVDGRQAIVSRYTEGIDPADHARARAFLFELANHFDQAGLPTWQIDPRQPRSLGNLLEGPDGEYTIIDLESGMVSPLASPRAWWRAIRRARVPLYDDVYFDVTRAYVAAHADEMLASRGADWFANLDANLDAAERASGDWHAAEPRIWSAALRFVWSGFGVGPLRRRAREAAVTGRAKADDWLDAAITQWEAESRLTPPEAARLRESLAEPGVQEVLPHFGVHLVIGIALRFPFGSIVRASYTTANLLFATGRVLSRRISFAKWRREFGIHSPLVIIVAAMPGIGTFAYLVSWPVLRHLLLARVAIDAVGQKLPFRVYSRLGGRWIIARRARQLPAAPSTAPADPEVTP